MEDKYSKINMSRKQAQQVAFAILADIEIFCETNREEYEQFLLEEIEKSKKKEEAEDGKHQT